MGTVDALPVKDDWHVQRAGAEGAVHREAGAHFFVWFGIERMKTEWVSRPVNEFRGKAAWRNGKAADKAGRCAPSAAAGAEAGVSMRAV